MDDQVLMDRIATRLIDWRHEEARCRTGDRRSVAAAKKLLLGGAAQVGLEDKVKIRKGDNGYIATVE